MNLYKQFFLALGLIAILSVPNVLSGLTNDIVAEATEQSPLWHPIDVDEESYFLFVAFEEAQLFRERLGQWLPRRFLPIEPNDECFWALRTAKIQNDEMLIYLSIWNKTQDLRNDAYWSFSTYSSKLSRHVKEIRLVQLADGTGFEIVYPESAESRRVGFLSTASVEEAKERFSISKSSVMWSWRIFSW